MNLKVSCCSVRLSNIEVSGSSKHLPMEMDGVYIQNFSLELISFEAVYKEDIAKYSFFALSILNTFVTVPMGFGVIWYEQNNHYRTLINKLASSICFYIFEWFIFVNFFALGHLINGPLGSSLCTLEVMVTNINAMQGMFMVIFIAITKYMFVYHVKNPVAIQEDFFAFFINLATAFWSTLSQFTFMWLPGRDPIMYHVCMGSFPYNKIKRDQAVKWNYPVYGLLFSSLIIHIISGYWVKKAKALDGPKLPATDVCNVANIQDSMEKKLLVNYKTSTIFIGIGFVSLYSTFHLNQLKVQDVPKHHNVVFIYFWQLCLPQLLAYSLFTTYYSGSSNLRNEVWLKIKELVQTHFRG